MENKLCFIVPGIFEFTYVYVYVFSYLDRLGF